VKRSQVNELSATKALDQFDDIAKLLLSLSLSLDPANLEHLKKVRKVLEYGNVRFAAANCTPDQAADLRRLIAKQGRYVDHSKEFIHADIDFHIRVAEITDNPILQALTKSLLSWLLEYYKTPPLLGRT